MVTIGQNDGVATYVHELGHHVEYNMKRSMMASSQFHSHRTKSTPTKPMSAWCPNCGFSKKEYGNDDNFGPLFTDKMRAAYTGKTYKGGATELVSMGLERLYKDPISFAQKDPEFFKFTVGTLHGEFNHSPYDF